MPYNLKSPAVKRILKEAQELSEPTYEYAARPLEDNIFEWHFTFRGPEGGPFEGGIYHGRIILPNEYPFKPPHIMMLNPNGRFELNKKICLSISGFHPESWQPSWSIRTALVAMIGFMETKADGAIGGLDYTAEERKILAKKSVKFSCPVCGPIADLLLSEKPANTEPIKELLKEEEVSKLRLVPESKSNGATKPTPTSTTSEVSTTEDNIPTKDESSTSGVTSETTSKDDNEPLPSSQTPPSEPSTQKEIPTSGAPTSPIETVARFVETLTEQNDNDTTNSSSDDDEPMLRPMNRNEFVYTPVDWLLYIAIGVLIHCVAYLVIRRLAITFGYKDL